MHSGLFLIFVVNVITAVIGVLVYRYIIMREVGRLTPDDIKLLRTYPTFRAPDIYAPFTSLARAAPPMRWTNWYDFFMSTESPLSRDAQVYLLFQRACIVISVVCALLSSFSLLPAYWFGVSVFPTEGQTPRNLLSLLRNDRGIFERFTSHNLPSDSPLLLIQLPVFLIVSLCIIVMYSVVNVAAGGKRSIEEWLQSGPNASSAAILPSLREDLNGNVIVSNRRSPHSPSRARHWTVFARGLPNDISSADQLYEMLDAIFPGQVIRVELVCKGKISEARLLRNLSLIRYRLHYLRNCTDEDVVDMPLPSQTFLGRIFSLFTRRRTRTEMIQIFESKIESLNSELQSRRALPVRDFRGCAFITFRSPEATRFALFNFPMRVRRRLTACHNSSNTNNISYNDVVRNNNNNQTNNNSSTNGDVDVDVTGGESTNSINTGHQDGAINSQLFNLDRMDRSRDSFIGQHTRTVSELDVPYFRNLAKGTANLLPSALRERLLPSPTTAFMQSNSHDELESGEGEMSASRRRDYAITRLRNMKAEQAPKSGDVIWSNLGMSFLERSVREMFVQVMVFAVLILFTSPVTMLTFLKLVFSELSLLTDPQVIFGNSGNTTTPTNSTGFAGGINDGMGLSFFKNLSADSGAAVESLSQDLLNVLPSFLTSNTYLTTAILAYLPVLMLAIVFAIVPTLLRMTCKLEGYATKSAMEMSVFRKTSFYYVMNAVVLPSLALNTASEFLEMVYKKSSGGVHVTDALPIFQRLFSGDIAYFLCSYLVQLGLTGSVFWLMRLPSSISMMIRRRMAVTPLEEAEAKCAEIFDYPRHYAYCVTVMSMVLLFGMMAPLLWYFALFYFVCKHAVDVYTLRYVHPRTHIDGRLPRLSANFILIWTIVSQVSLAIIFYLQGWTRAAMLSGFLCIVTLVGCMSAPSSVGNHMMSMVAIMRDAALDRVLRMVGPWYTHLDEVAGLSNSSSSNNSSTTSLTDVRESDALLSYELTQPRYAVDVNRFTSLKQSDVTPNYVSFSSSVATAPAFGSASASASASVPDSPSFVDAGKTNDACIKVNDEMNDNSNHVSEGDITTNGYDSDEDDDIAPGDDGQNHDGAGRPQHMDLFSNR